MSKLEELSKLCTRLFTCDDLKQGDQNNLMNLTYALSNGQEVLMFDDKCTRLLTFSKTDKSKEWVCEETGDVMVSYYPFNVCDSFKLIIKDS